MYHYGRPKGNHASPTKTDASHANQGAGMILILGCVMLTGFFLHMLVPNTIPQESPVPTGYTAVMNTVPAEEVMPEQVMASEKEERYHTGAEPFGYLDGEWNLWEYIGDLMVSLLS